MVLRIGIAGATGRMGRMVVKEALAIEDCVLAAASVRPGGEHTGKDVGTVLRRETLGIIVTDEPHTLVEACDAVIDFTTPDATMGLAKYIADAGKIHIIGTTGLNDAQKTELKTLGEKARIVWSPNMSHGVNLLMRLVEQAAALLGPEYDIEILEMHHRHKIDTPSGTALALGEMAARGRIDHLKNNLEAHPLPTPPPPAAEGSNGVAVTGGGVTTKHKEMKFIRARDGMTGPREPGGIGFASMRGGDVVGDHTVVFAGPGERIELTHKASSREIYARGALRAALWAKDRPCGLYNFRDLLSTT